MTPVRLEPTALRSRVKHSTTEPLRSQLNSGTGLLVTRGHGMELDCLLQWGMVWNWIACYKGAWYGTGLLVTMGHSIDS